MRSRPLTGAKLTSANDQRSVSLAQASSACVCKIKDCFYFYIAKDIKLFLAESAIDYFRGKRLWLKASGLVKRWFFQEE